MIQSYCVDIAAVGDGKSKPTKTVGNGDVPKCNHCGKKDCFQGHTTKALFDLLNHFAQGAHSHGDLGRFFGFSRCLPLLLGLDTVLGEVA